MARFNIKYTVPRGPTGVRYTRKVTDEILFSTNEERTVRRWLDPEFYGYFYVEDTATNRRLTEVADIKLVLDLMPIPVVDRDVLPEDRYDAS